MKKLKKAVIPVAGLGTRFLPATKSIPKEMLPIVDAPIIFYVMEEAVKAGIEDIIFITGRHKYPLEDFFDTSYELEDKLLKEGKEDVLARIRAIKDMANIISIRQKEAKGLGHAVYCARPAVGEEPFAVLLGDELTVSSPGQPTPIGSLKLSYDSCGESVVGVIEVPAKDVFKYGIVAPTGEKKTMGGFEAFKVGGVIEKPDVGSAPSQFALPGRYTFSPEIFDILADTKPGVKGEVQLSDAMAELARRQGLWALNLSNATRYDAGDKLGFLIANIELGLKHPEVGEDLRQYLRNLKLNF